MKLTGTGCRLCFFWLALLIASGPEARAQLTVVQGADMNLTPQQLVQNYLVGSGITVSNVTFNGSSALITSDQVGVFGTQGPATEELGLTGGILMTSGKAELAIGPNNKSNAGYGTGGTGDPDLTIIAETSTFDKAVIEFDFIPQYDTIRFRYVFGSEEFFEYCNSINDAFGFFLSGPGINGTFSNNAENIALMPGSQSLYVTINNICDNQFSRWDNAGGDYFQYDALTHVFTALAVVQPCSTYHIKLAIADAVDHILDSGVFLEENSFSSIGVNLLPSNTNPSIGNTAVEGCNDVTVNFMLTEPPDYAYTVNYFISGTAENGTDYTVIPSSVTFPAGVDSIPVVIHPLLDLTPEGPESVIITIDQISCDGSVTADTFMIMDYIPMSLIAQQNDTVVCHGAEVTLKALAADGYEPRSYHWNVSAATDSVIEVLLPVGNNICIATITDLCGNSIGDTSEALVHPTPVADAGADQMIPNGTSTNLQGNASGGYGVYAYSWTSNPPGFTSSEQNPNTGNLYYSTMFLLETTDVSTQCASSQDETIVAIEGGILSANPIANPDAVCDGTSTQLFALGGGGSGFYTYSWTSTPFGFISAEANPVVTPAETTVYHLSLSDGFNTVTGSTTVTVLPLPQIHLGPVDTLLCIYDTVTLDAGNPGSAYEWSDGQTTRTITAAAVGIGFEMQTFSVIVTNAAGCIDSASINLVFSFGACTGIPEEADVPATLYPNPTDGTLTLVLRETAGSCRIRILDMVGRALFSGRTEPGTDEQGRSTCPVDLSRYQPGIYFIQWSTGDRSGMLKAMRR